MQSLFDRFVTCESGVTAIEYGLIAALIGVAIIAALTTLGAEVAETFQDTAKGMAKRPAVT